MENQVAKLVMGSLLYDLSKALRRGKDGQYHYQNVYEFLKDDVKLKDEDILNQVRFRSEKKLKRATMAKSSLTYITFVADQFAAGVDGRVVDRGKSGVQEEARLSSIFNVLNNNDEDKVYPLKTLKEQGKIINPEEKEKRNDEDFYEKLREELINKLQKIELTSSYVNSLLELFETYLTYVSSSSNNQIERADISLFDHMKMTAAIASSAYLYLSGMEENNYEYHLFRNKKEFSKQKAFALYSLDMSGIQDFIYTISSKGALKSLRSRSFYLEIMMEHLIDEFLSDLNLTRANVLYTGGGHGYLILPHLKDLDEKIKAFETRTKAWFMETFNTSLYLSGGYTACSINDLMNQPEGSYRQIFLDVGRKLSMKKLQRYTAEDITKLNHHKELQNERECSVCRRRDLLDKGDKCRICSSIERFSTKIIEEEIFMVLRGNSTNHSSLPLPGGKSLHGTDLKTLQQMKNDPNYVRSYVKNKPYTRESISTNLWIGDYLGGKTFEEMSDDSHGIRRLGVMRGDIDNLGKAFISGFEHKKYGEKYVTLSRTATFSRSLSLFMKYHINTILSQGTFYLDPRTQPGPRKIAIVYSGGDDTFVVGAWDEVIGFSVDLYHHFNEFTQSTLTYSAGIAVFPPKFPIITMAKETALLEEVSKGLKEKNGISLFHEDYAWPWPVFIEKVLKEKLSLIQSYFSGSSQHGMSFLYHLLDLIKNREEKINLARYAYLLARMEPNRNAEAKVKEAYGEFSSKMYSWMKDQEDCRQLEMAIQIYVYLNRNNEEDSNE